MRFDQYIQNPRAVAIRKFMFEILDQKYLEYEDLIERMASYLVTDKDLSAYGKMIGDVYELGYKRAVEDCRGQLSEMGISVNVKTKTPA